jgi:hypothetical protein
MVSFNAHTCMGDRECFTSISHSTMAIVQGEKAATKGSTRLQQTSPGGGGDGGGGGGVAGVFLFS